MENDKCTVGVNWLDDSSYQEILMEAHMIAFEFDAVQKKQRVSPYIREYIAGNYDGRMLSDVMVEDKVIHPEDVGKAVAFKEQIIIGNLGEMVIRLLTPGGEYRWFRMLLTHSKSKDKKQIYVGVLEDVDMQMKDQELLRRRAEVDQISGIYNRETFFEYTQKILNANNGSTYYLICFDIDRFKLINKLFGNSEGDKVLRYVGDILRQQTLPNETFGRLGNDIFAVCVYRSQTETITLVNEIADRLQNYPLTFRFFLATGIVAVNPGCTNHINELCDWAMMARQKIKGNYLCRYSFYEPLMGAALEREHELIVNMEKALKEEQFWAYFQPKYDMRSGKIIGAEALARWNHPTLGMVSPEEFIPLFERNGFIIKMDEYIWELTCRTIRGWIDRGITPVPVSVNVSRIHLYNENFCECVRQLCSKYEIPHHLLELEITESAYTDCPQELFPIMDILQQDGFSFSMDDFGSGYSSLNILKDIPVNIVKFDLRFLGEARKGEWAGRSILKNIIQLMKDLEISVLAEGVETESQAKFLQDAGCYYGQGYYYAWPMQIQEFERLLV